MKILLIILGTVAGYFVLGYTLVALNIIALPLFKLQTKVNLNYQLIQKTYNVDNALYNYHWFLETKGSIDALTTQIAQSQTALESFEVSAGARTSWTFEDKTEDNRLRAVVLGEQQQKESLINSYNAHASEADRNIFQNGLPIFIPLN